MKNIIVISPHPDDETLGCGGTLLKEVERGNNINWLIVTSMNKEQYGEKRVAERQEEIKKVASQYQFNSVNQLPYHTTDLDCVPKSQLVGEISHVFNEILPNIVYVPYPSDIHSDHAAVFDAAMACTKWFRYPSVEKVLIYETLSETDFVMNPDANGFRPNIFIDITETLDQKLNIMKLYKSEIADHPFPRSETSIRALATLRGAAAGVEAAEGFMLVKERVL